MSRNMKNMVSTLMNIWVCLWFFFEFHIADFKLVK